MSANIQYCIHNPNAEYVVLSSGLGGHASFWKPQIEALQACFHVLSYDQEGCHADSDLLHDDYCFDDLARQILKILKQHDIQKFHFIGHAIGSFIGAELALLCSAHHLEMLSLTCINAWDRLDPHTAKCFEARIQLLKHAGAEPYVRAQALFLYPPAWISHHHQLITKAENIQLEDFPPIQNVLLRINAAQNFKISKKHCEVLESVAVHLIANTDDFLVPVNKSKDLKKRLGDSALSIQSYGAHASTVTASDVMNQIVMQFYYERGFLSKLKNM